MIFGDSLSAAYRLEEKDGWVALLQQKVNSEAPSWRVINRSVSGYTTLDGLNTIDYELSNHQPRIVILELGANDGLRGYPIESIKHNLALLIDRSQSAGAFVILAGMQLPQNYGPQYLDGFKELYETLAEEKQTGLIPFLLDGVATDTSQMQEDFIHPNEKGQPQILKNVWQTLEPHLEQLNKGST